MEVEPDSTKVHRTPRTIYERPLSSLPDTHEPIDIAPKATLQRYRLVYCRRFVDECTLQIDGFDEFPNVEYATISYVWHGNKPDSICELGQLFAVKGAEDADLISVNLLRQTRMVVARQAVHPAD